MFALSKDVSLESFLVGPFCEKNKWCEEALSEKNNINAEYSVYLEP